MGSILSPPYPLPLNPGADRGGTDSDMDCIKGGRKMRGLRFRAWDKVAGRFLHPWPDGFAILGETTCFDLIGMQLKERSPEKSTLEMLNDVVIMQFTGILDKNGKEIYEGDVIRAHAEGYDRPMEWTVVFDEARFTLINEHDRIGLHYWANSQLEIIGNIYEMTP